MDLGWPPKAQLAQKPKQVRVPCFPGEPSDFVGRNERQGYLCRHASAVDVFVALGWRVRQALAPRATTSFGKGNSPASSASDRLLGIGFAGSGEELQSGKRTQASH